LDFRGGKGKGDSRMEGKEGSKGKKRREERERGWDQIKFG